MAGRVGDYGFMSPRTAALIMQLQEERVPEEADAASAALIATLLEEQQAHAQPPDAASAALIQQLEEEDAQGPMGPMSGIHVVALSPNSQINQISNGLFSISSRIQELSERIQLISAQGKISHTTNRKLQIEIDQIGEHLTGFDMLAKETQIVALRSLIENNYPAMLEQLEVVSKEFREIQIEPPTADERASEELQAKMREEATPIQDRAREVLKQVRALRFQLNSDSVVQIKNPKELQIDDETTFMQHFRAQIEELKKIAATSPKKNREAAQTHLRSALKLLDELDAWYRSKMPDSSRKPEVVDPFEIDGKEASVQPAKVVKKPNARDRQEFLLQALSEAVISRNHRRRQKAVDALGEEFPGIRSKVHKVIFEMHKERSEEWHSNFRMGHHQKYGRVVFYDDAEAQALCKDTSLPNILVTIQADRLAAVQTVLDRIREQS